MFVLAVFGVLGLVLFLAYRHLWAPFQLWQRLGIKGPKPTPLIGNVPLMRKLGVMTFLSGLLEEYGPIVGFYMGPNPWLVVSDLDVLKHVLVKDFDCFVNRPTFLASMRPKSLRPGFLQEQGRKWKVARQTLTPTFSAAKMKMMVPLMENSVKGLMKIMKEVSDSGQSRDIFKIFSSFTMETILAIAFGRVVDLQAGENDELTNAASQVFRNTQLGKGNIAIVSMIQEYFPFLHPILEWYVAKSPQGVAFETLRKVSVGLVEARRQSGTQTKYKDLLQLMLEATVQEDGDQACPAQSDTKFSNEQIVRYSISFLLAGYETTANTLSYTAYLLALHPDIQERLQEEIDSYLEDNSEVNLYEAAQEISYLDWVLQESLRIYSPAQSTARSCEKTVTINGLTIPKGATVLVPIGYLHKQPQYWEDPEKFNPERFSPEGKANRPPLCYMPFGHGPRNCIGMRFALLEAKLALIEVLRKFSFVRSPDTEVPLKTVLGITMAPKNGIFIKIIARD